MEIKVLKNILSANDEIAEGNRALLDKNNVFAVNIMASPGAGKTSLILETIRRLKDRVSIGVIEGDITSSVDAETVGKEGVPVVQINTGGGCSLEATMVSSALPRLPLEKTRVLFIENVGNLVCPASFELGEHRKLVIASIPEGDDKPTKYPLMYVEADVVIINKTDLLPYVDFDLAHFQKVIKGLNPEVTIFEVSCKTGEGLDAWCSWLEDEARKSR